MEIQDIQSADFDSVVKQSPRPVVLEFWVRSCGFCQKFKPVYEKLPEVFDGVSFVKMNMLKSIENLRMAEGMGVEETPTTKLFCKGREVGEIVGYKNLEEATDIIETLLESNNCI